MSRRTKIWLTVGLLIAGGLLGVVIYKDKLAAASLRQVATLAEKSGHRITFGGVHVSLMDGNIRLTDLNVVPILDSTVEDHKARYTIHADAIDLRGVDIPALFRRNVLHVASIELHGPSLLHSFSSAAVEPVREDSAKRAPPSMPLDVLRIDTLLITDATGRSQERGSTAPALAVGNLDLLITGIRLTSDADGRPVPEVSTIRLDIHDARTQVKPFNSLVLDSMRVRIPEDTAILFGLHFTPDVSPKDYHEHVTEQVELYEANVDTILLDGFDLAIWLDSRKIGAHQLYVGGANVGIHRDKSIPEGPIRPKPLAADRLADMQALVHVDTVRVRRTSITYNERLKVTDEYGSIAFTDISGRLTGFSTEWSGTPPDLRLEGSARVGSATAELDMRMPMHAEHTTVDARVLLRGFPASGMNRMTDDLLHVEATHGIIHLVDLRMTGDEDRAHGTIDMRYEDLELKLGSEIKHAKLLSKVANTVVRTSNMPGEKGYRKGSFDIARPVDAGAFKYIWIALREGMMDVALPPMVLKQLRAQQAKKK